VKCPNCAAEAGDDAAECPACGLVFAKWRERQEKEKREAAEALRLLDEGPKPPPTLWVRRAAAFGAVLIWLSWFVYYVYRHTQRLPSRG
jgi:hypothetical protein